MSEPRTPMSTGSSKSRPISETADLVTVTDPDGTVWQHYDYWPDTEPPAPGRTYWITDCRWVLRDDGTFVRHINRWQYTEPLRRPMIDQPDEVVS